MRFTGIRSVLPSVAALSVLVASVVSVSQHDHDEALEEEVEVCVGTSGQHAAGDDAHLEIVSEAEVLAGAVFPVPGQVVLFIPSSAHEPRLLLDGRPWASAPRGGGWGITQGEGCPIT